ncbi:hypothetical protein [Knoellia aerolata]|uniref:Uncharacterized protein n=1 Tax=Knoellia aerolata DSM 18566 TaxID=1385519 RepID=A0A0A0JY89_9MICO|nr:hypothetical protein [Knoellia aerolata]KGN42158.1 hypothetical protein N801_02815 [Knoellia aerolata DSM 18566]
MSGEVEDAVDEAVEDAVDEAVAAAAAALYAVPQTEFIPTRKALAATAKSSAGPAAAKAVLALRKPTLTAWAMNLVPRAGDGSLADVLGLGARMRAAQSTLDTATLTSVRGERDATLTAYVEAVATAAEAEGVELSPAAREEVRASAIAALADETAARALASGQLTRSLHYSGFGEVDLSGAVGVTSSGSIISVLRGGARSSRVPAEPAEAERESAASEDANEDDDELTEEELAAAVAEARAAKAAAKARRLAQAELEAAQAGMSEAQAGLRAAEDAARRARQAVIAAQKRLDSARAAVAGPGR